MTTETKTTTATATETRTTTAPKGAATSAIQLAAPSGALQLGVPEETISALEKLFSQGKDCLALDGVRKVFIQGALIYNLNQILTPKVMQYISWMQNYPLGFLTDRQNGGYDVDTVRACVVEAGMRGLNITGNEFNIISGRCYVTKNGLKHMLKNIPGLRFGVTPALPKMIADKQATILMHIDWTFNGVKQEKDVEFSIRVNAGMGADAIIGKATRKAYAWLYEEVTNNSVDEGEISDVSDRPAQAKTSPLEVTPAQAQAQAIAPASDEQQGLLDM